MSTAPTILAVVKDVNPYTIALTGNEFKLIRYRSTARATMEATAYGGAQIIEDSQMIKHGGQTAYGTTYDFNNVVNGVFRFSVEDSNGSYRQEIKDVDLIPYIELTCEMSNSKPDADGSMRLSCTGDYFNGSFGEKSNTLTVKYRYSKNNGTSSSWRNMTVSINGNRYSAYADLSGLDYTASYTFAIQAEDELTITSSSEEGVRSLPVFHWGADDFVFEVPVTFNAGAEGLALSEIEDDLTIRGNLRLQGDGSDFGNKLNFGDGNYCYIAEETDDDLTLNADTINFVADQLQMNGENVYLPEYGMWTPELDSNALNYYNTHHGWYSRAGYVVTVGFYLKANCYSGYEDDDIIITGLPFKPSYSASGGGICSGVHVPSGFTFQCFVAEEDEYEITVRVQKCDQDYDGDLSTSASGCGYPEEGGSITLSGTITYMSDEW